MLRFILPALLALASLLALPAMAEDAVAVTPYQKFVGETFVSDLDGQTVTLNLVYTGLVDSNITTLYKYSKIKVKNKVFLVHHDPAGQPVAPAMPGASPMPQFAVSLPKASAEALMAVSPGTQIQITGVAQKAVFGYPPARSVSVYVEGTGFTVVAP
jgi:hypothetical protein